MGMEKKHEKELIAELEEMADLRVRCRSFDLFQNKGALGGVFDLLAARSDITIFYWDIDRRPSRLKMELVFFLFGLMGLQYRLLSFARRPIIILPSNPCASFLHADLAAYLRILGKNVYLAHSLADIQERIRHITSPPVLGGKKVLIFGEPFKSTTIRTPALTKEHVRRKTGVVVDYRPLKDLVTGVQKVDRQKVKAEMDRWMGEARHVKEGLLREIEGACRLYLYVKESIERGGYSGISVSCITKSFPENHLTPYPCLALSRFRDSGISAVCEGDLCALLTSMLMEHAANKPSYMGNVAHVDEENGHVAITHCVTALKMNGYDAEPLSYSLEDYHHTGKGVVPSVSFPKGGEVTLGLVSKDLRSFVLWPGLLVDSGADFCVNMARIKIDDPKGFRQKIAGCHYVMVYGNIVKELQKILLDLEITPMGPTGA